MMLWPALWVLIALVLGFAADRFLLGCLTRAIPAKQHPWVGVALEAIRPAVIFWFAIAGIHAAMITSSLDRNVVRILDDVLLVLGVGSLTWVAARFTGGAIHAKAATLGPRVLSASLLASIVQAVIVTIGVLVILQSLGIAIAPLLTALGVGGLAVALALQPTLANLFAGLQLVASKAVRPGDYISVSGFEGFVEDITWRTIAIRDISNNVVFVPNLTISTTAFVNYRIGAPAVAIELPFTIKAGSDPDLMERAAIDAANDALKELGVASPSRTPPSVHFEGVGDGSIQARLLLYVPEAVDATKARNETVKRLFRALNPSAA